MTPKLYITRTPDGVDLPLPRYASKYHCGLQLMAAIPAPIKLEPGERAYLPTGFMIGIPTGFCGLITSLPEQAKELGIVVLGAPQLVNPADREPLFIIVQNASLRPVLLHRGQMVAQLVITPVIQVAWEELRTRISDETTSEKTMLLDDADKPAPEEQAKPKREAKPIRGRFKSQDAK